jgi:hypothetical protein
VFFLCFVLFCFLVNELARALRAVGRRRAYRKEHIWDIWYTDEGEGVHRKGHERAELHSLRREQSGVQNTAQRSAQRGGTGTGTRNHGGVRHLLSGREIQGTLIRIKSKKIENRKRFIQGRVAERHIRWV